MSFEGVEAYTVPVVCTEVVCWDSSSDLFV